MAPNPSDLAVAERAWRIRTAAFLILLAVVLLGGSGQIDWIAGTAYVLVNAAGHVITYRILRKASPDLIVERTSRFTRGAKPWDKVILLLIGVALPVPMYVIAALDVRYSWSHVSLAWQLAGFAMVIAGFALILWAMVANRFFAATVRIQSERGHTVISGGPYAYVRHPGYVGIIVYTMGTPLALGGTLALWPAALQAVVLIVRTVLEDRMLRRELPGYADYAGRVRARLLPMVW